MLVPMRVRRDVAFAGGACVILVSLLFWMYGGWRLDVSTDLDLYLGYTRSWLAGGPMYQPFQLAGPYSARDLGGALYPPLALYLFVPFTFLPAVLWYALPLGATAAVVVRLRPAIWTWPLLLACVVWPMSLAKIVSGNPVMWALAAESLAVLYSWPGVLVLLKPSLAPFALVGVRSRGWWLAAGVLVLLALPYGAKWGQWVAAMLNERTQGGLFYSLLEAPLLMLPLVAQKGRTRR